jgi:hypothetical protein
MQNGCYQNTFQLFFGLFALKCAEDRLNNLVHHADGQTPYETIASLDPSKIKISNFHTFGSPCYVLDQRLQSGASMIPKWEPQARMGIYVGRSPLHASNVTLVLNPRTGHTSPQFHVGFNDDFTTVEYLCKMTVPPHWAELVRSSADMQLYSEHQASTWQSLPDIDKEVVDFLYEQTTTPASTSTQACEGVELRTTHNMQNGKPVQIEKEINYIPATNISSQNMWQMPPAIYLDSSDLRCSS